MIRALRNLALAAMVWAAGGWSAPPVLADASAGLLGQQDFVYQGYYAVPRGGAFAELNYGQGFTHRYVNGQLRFLTLSFYGNVPGGGYQLIEFAPPASLGGTVATTTNHWADIFAGTGVSGNNGAWIGLWYEQAKERLWTTWAIDYPDDVQAQYTKSLTIRKLNANGTISQAAGAWGLSGVQQRRIYGGVTVIPQWFQDQYGVGPYGVGWGGYASRMGLGTSLGPTFYAIPEPTNYPVGDIPAGQFKTLMDHSSGTRSTDWYEAGHPTSFDRGVRNSDVDNDYDGGTEWTSPAPDGLGRWVWGDSAWNTGAWIETPAKHGFIIVPKFCSGRAWYQSSTLHCERQTAEIQVFDPAVLGQVSQGARQPWNVYPSSRWQITGDMTPLGLGAGFAGNSPYSGPGGATYDATRRTLYVYCQYAANLNSYILVYKVSAHPGDVNGDNDCDFADYQLLEVNFGRTSGATLDMGDFDGDRDVDFADYQVLETNLGWAIPEPGCAILLALGAAFVVRRSATSRTRW